jgi:hypothetical protein
LKTPAPFVSLVLAGALTAGVGCSIVDLGDPPADVNACQPPQEFFVTDIWPNYLAKSYGGKTCADANCHGTGTSSALRLVADPKTPNPVTFPLVGGTDWFANYNSASQSMNCTDVTGSALYTTPSGIDSSHGGGMLFSAGGPEFDLLQQWVMAGP